MYQPLDSYTRLRTVHAEGVVERLCNHLYAVLSAPTSGQHHLAANHSPLGPLFPPTVPHIHFTAEIKPVHVVYVVVQALLWHCFQYRNGKYGGLYGEQILIGRRSGICIVVEGLCVTIMTDRRASSQKRRDPVPPDRMTDSRAFNPEEGSRTSGQEEGSPCLQPGRGIAVPSAQKRDRRAFSPEEGSPCIKPG